MNMMLAARPDEDEDETVRPAERRNWMAAIQPYRSADPKRAIFELVTTFVPFAIGLAGMAASVLNGWIWLYALLLLPTVGLLVRLFMIQHDCGHGAFFPGRRANLWTGRLIGLLTLTPYDHWQRTHAMHHAGAGNLDRRGVGDIDTLTVDEYDARSFFGRLRYRLYRHPVVMFLIGPTYVFAIQNRIPVGFMRRGAMPWWSTMGTNAGILALLIAASLFIGPVAVALTFAPVMIGAATTGVWLFYVQHQFEDTYWEKSAGWDAQDAALMGSSYYDLPQPLRWFSGCIGLHHIHHLSSRVPFYRLQEVLDDYPELKEVRRITLSGGFATVPLVLWDEAASRLISFADYRALKREALSAAA
jgi:acyl-lipid omega-6 desaturase (Delta-12 desaturase)